MGLKPIGDRIIVRRQAADEKTAGGIILPALRAAMLHPVRALRYE